jgi:hypothetical protein
MTSITAYGRVKRQNCIPVNQGATLLGTHSFVFEKNRAGGAIMSIFTRIDNAIRQGKERAYLEVKEDIDKIEMYDFESASKIFYTAVKTARSLTQRTELVKIYQQKLNNTNSGDAYGAFEYMYSQYKRRGDMLAFNISQRIGKKLYNDGYSMVREVETGENSTMIVPYFERY